MMTISFLHVIANAKGMWRSMLRHCSAVSGLLLRSTHANDEFKSNIFS